MAAKDDGPDALELSYIFVPRGAPEPTAWLRDHPGAISLPARLALGAGASRDFSTSIRSAAPDAVASPLAVARDVSSGSGTTGV